MQVGGSSVPLCPENNYVPLHCWCVLFEKKIPAVDSKIFLSCFISNTERQSRPSLQVMEYVAEKIFAGKAFDTTQVATLDIMY